MTAHSRYDSDSGLRYISDAGFIDTGSRMNIDVEFNGSNMPVYDTLRSFPEGNRNCYTLKPPQGKNTSYLIKVHFKYGNYDGLRKIPKFHLYIDVNFWAKVLPESINYWFFKELIYTPREDNIHVCLVNIGLGVPLISGLELKPLNNSIYKSTTGALRFFARYDSGSTSTTKVYHRYYSHFLELWSHHT
ncbi:hypothetical protein RDABS01_034075 [Bienertia sinuspersici]